MRRKGEDNAETHKVKFPSFEGKRTPLNQREYKRYIKYE